MLAFDQHMPATVLLMPIVILPLLPLLLGLSWLLASLGVFIRDIGQMVGLVVSLLMFMSPVFYSARSLAPRWQFWMDLNPLTPVIENLRLVVFAGGMPDWTQWSMGLAVGAVAAVAGAWFFSKTRNGFADVL